MAPAAAEVPHATTRSVVTRKRRIAHLSFKIRSPDLALLIAIMLYHQENVSIVGIDKNDGATDDDISISWLIFVSDIPELPFTKLGLHFFNLGSHFWPWITVRSQISPQITLHILVPFLIVLIDGWVHLGQIISQLDHLSVRD